MLELKIHEQSIETVNSTDYTRGTVGAKVKITFDDFWADYEKTVVFKRCYDTLSNPIKILVNTMSVTLDIPPEILAESGKYKIGAIGIKNGVVLPTLYSEEFNSLYATDTKGFKNADKYTPSELEQLRLSKQDKLTAGENITIDENNVISVDDDGFVEKANGNTMTDQVYAVNVVGQQIAIDVEDNKMYESGAFNFAGLLPRRNTNGNLYTGNPVADMDCTNKKYVDDKIGDIDSALDELHNYAQALIGGNS